MMLRECVRFEVLAKSVLESEDFFNFFEYVEVSTFDIASDAFATFKVRFVCIQWFLEKTANLKMSWEIKVYTILNIFSLSKFLQVIQCLRAYTLLYHICLIAC